MERLFAFLQANDIKNVELYGYPGNPFPTDGNPQGNLQGSMALRALGDKYGIRFPARHGGLSEGRWDGEIAHAKILGQDHIGDGSSAGAGGLGSYTQTLGDRGAAQQAGQALGRGRRRPRVLPQPQRRVQHALHRHAG